MMNNITTYLPRLHHISSTSSIIKQLTEQMETHLHQRYMAPLSYRDIYRARNELKLIKSIESRLKKGKYILRCTDKSGIFHLSHAIDYEQKADAYRHKTGAYIELESDPLWSIIDKVVRLLNDLRSEKHILSWQLDQMMPKRENVALTYLYFITKPHKEGTPLRPTVSPMNTPTTGISKFLDQLLRPLFDKHGYHKVKGVPVDAIRKLARIVITENAFVYEQKFYRQILNGAMGSAFTLTLANIFMWKWEKELVYRQHTSNEIYGRYIDDIFFTSNESLETINEMLDKANQFHANIKLVRQLGTSISFIDIYIENKNGALMRAIRYSSTLTALNEERRSVKLMLLYNSCPPRYILNQFHKFFSNHLPTSLILPMISTEIDFAFIRYQLLIKPTITEYQIASRIAKTIDVHNKEEVDNPLVKARLDKRSKYHSNLIIHYTHEQRLQNNKKDIHQLWNQTFEQRPVLDTRLIIENRNSRNMTRELVNRCSPL